jgi:3-dehydroquinate synthase
MSTIARTFRVQFVHRVHFTRRLFAPSNSLLQTLLAQPGRVLKVLAVLDEGLAQARPELPHAIESYFSGLSGQLALTGPPLIIEGGERAKMSYFHVSEIHSQIERTTLTGIPS